MSISPVQLASVSPREVLNKQLDFSLKTDFMSEKLSLSDRSEEGSRIFEQLVQDIKQPSGKGGMQLADAGDIEGINQYATELAKDIGSGTIEAKVDLLGLIPGKSIVKPIVKQMIGVEVSTNGSAAVFAGDKNVGGYAVEMDKNGDVTGKIQLNNSNNVISINQDDYVESQVAIPLAPNVTVGMTQSTDPDKKDTYNVNVGPVQVDVVPPANVMPVIEYITQPEVIECGVGASCGD